MFTRMLGFGAVGLIGLAIAAVLYLVIDALSFSEFLQIGVIALSAMVPVTLAAVGEIIGERAGVINIGLEGILLISAIVGAYAAEQGGTYLGEALAPFIGLLAGILVGLILGMLHGLVSVYWKGNHIISGVGINLLGAGFVAFGLIALWGIAGYHPVPSWARMPQLPTPYGGISYVTFLTLALAVAVYWLVYRTKLGIRIGVVGEHPRSADVAGVNVDATRFWATAIGASFAGLGGAFMSLDWFGVVTSELAAGRGFIGLATVVFSKLNPLLAIVGGLIFGFFDSLAVWVSNSSELKQVLPWQFVRTLPYVVTLLAVAGALGRARFPSKLGEPYYRE
ncbi:MAG: ABC transporter permease [Candidatus Bipolaricaulia bacterium]